jgi:uncharacterized membrane protein
LVARMGERGFAAVYSLLSLALFVPLVWVYFANKHTGAVLWQLPVGAGLEWSIIIAMGVAFVMLVSGLMQPSAASMGSGEVQTRGILLITRHPMFMAMALFGALHLVANGSTTDVAFFGGFPLFSLLGTWHQDRRKLAQGLPGYRRFCESTPYLPFSGSRTVEGLRGLPSAAVLIGIAVTALLRYYHGAWFGG